MTFSSEKLHFVLACCCCWLELRREEENQKGLGKIKSRITSILQQSLNLERNATRYNKIMLLMCKSEILFVGDAIQEIWL